MNERADTTRIPSHAGRSWYRRPVAWVGAASVAAAVALTATLTPLAAATAAPATTSAIATAPGVRLPFSFGSNPYAGGTASSSGAATQAATAATAPESTGLVLIDTVLGYDGAEAAGTGIVLTSGGLVLTNNHVVAGSTKIAVTVASTGQTYTGTVVGTDSTDDVAVIQLTGASGLSTAAIDDQPATIGDAVTAVGNADGHNALTAAAGTVTALSSDVTTSAEGPAASESLHGMIQISADVVPGDSGGAVLDGQGEVVGMTTAASVGSASTEGFAIPIERALTIASDLVAGDQAAGVTIGYPAFLGVEVSPSASASTRSGVTVGGVFESTPAVAAGLVAGDTITAIDGTAVSNSAALSSTLSAHKPGDSVTVTWTDAAGASHSASVTLAQGPAA